MYCFKEWLVLDDIRTNIYEPLQSQIIMEGVLLEFLRLFREDTEEESDCVYCGYHGEFDEKDGQKVCPSCGEADIVEIPDPFADGDEDAKPKEIDQDAIDKSKEDAARAREEEEAEKARRQQIAANRAARKMGLKKKDDEDDLSSTMNPDQLEFAKRLRDSALWIRWHAILERKNNVDRLRELSKIYEKENPEEAENIKSGAGIDGTRKRVSESSGFFDDDEDEVVSRPQSPSRGDFNMEEVVKILTGLGYISPTDLAKKTPQKRKEKILSAMFKASEEKGNDLPADLDAKDLMEPVLDSRGQPVRDESGRAKMRPTEVVEKAKSQFASDIAGFDPSTPDTFRNAFQGVVSQNQGSFSGAQKDPITKRKVSGHVHYSDPEDVADDLLISLNDLLTKRKVNKEGNVSKWGAFHRDHPDLGSSGKEELDGNEFVGRILGSWRKRAFSLLKDAQRKRRMTMSPSGINKDEVTQRTEVNARLSKDLSATRNAVRIADMMKSGKSVGELTAEFGLSAKEINDVVKNPYEPLRFHINYLRALANNAQDSVPASTKEDKYRLELMKQIEILASRNSQISLDPNQILSTLTSYQSDFATKAKKNPVFAGGGGDKEDDLYDAWSLVSSGDDASDKGGVFSGKTDNRTPAANAVAAEQRGPILSELYRAMRLLTMNGKNGPRQALAVCKALGLPCSDGGIDPNTGKYLPMTGRISRWPSMKGSNDSISAILRLMPKSKDDKCKHCNGYGKIDMQICPECKGTGKRIRACYSQLLDLSTVNQNQLREKLAQAGFDVSGSTAWGDLRAGLTFICNHMGAHLSQA